MTRIHRITDQSQHDERRDTYFSIACELPCCGTAAPEQKALSASTSRPVDLNSLGKVVEHGTRDGGGAESSTEIGNGWSEIGKTHLQSCVQGMPSLGNHF